MVLLPSTVPSLVNGALNSRHASVSPLSPLLFSFSSSVVTCGIPGYVEHGQTVGFGHSFGDSVVTACKPGFELVGSPRRSCLSNGTWSGEKPRCQGEIVHHFSSSLFSPEVTCTPVSDPEHGTAIVTTRRGRVLASNAAIPINAEVTFSCAKGYQLEGLSLVHCLKEGRLSGDPPICQPLPCVSPPVWVFLLKLLILNDQLSTHLFAVWLMDTWPEACQILSHREPRLPTTVILATTLVRLTQWSVALLQFGHDLCLHAPLSSAPRLSM